jgi:hypothetical protein
VSHHHDGRPTAVSQIPKQRHHIST